LSLRSPRYQMANCLLYKQVGRPVGRSVMQNRETGLEKRAQRFSLFPKRWSEKAGTIASADLREVLTKGGPGALPWRGVGCPHLSPSFSERILEKVLDHRAQGIEHSRAERVKREMLSTLILHAPDIIRNFIELVSPPLHVHILGGTNLFSLVSPPMHVHTPGGQTAQTPTSCTSVGTDNGVGIPKPIGDTLSGILRGLASIGAVVCALGIAVGGIMRATSFGNERRVSDSNTAITCAVVGLVVVLVAIPLGNWLENLACPTGFLPVLHGIA
jgi:hypothetical protein